METIQVRESTHPDVPVQGIVALLREVFPNSQHTVESFAWKHIANPAGPSIVSYAMSKGAVIAFRALWRFDLLQSGRRVIAYQPCDSATAQQFRRRGYFRATTEAALVQARQEGAQLLFNFPNPSSLPAYRALGWQLQDRLSRYILPVRGSQIIYGLFIKPKTFGASQLDPCFEASATSNRVDDTLCKNNDREGGLKPLFSREILQWRLLEHPTRRFGMADAKDGPIVYRLKQRYGLRELEIIHVTSVRQAMCRSLLLFLARKENADFISIIQPGTFPFRWPCFVRVPSKINFVALSLQPTETPFSWSFTPMYLDTV